MTDEIKEDIQENTEPTEDKKTLEISITLPDPFRLLHWNLYSTAKAKYYADERRSGRTGDEISAKFYGALALINEKYAIVTGLDEFEKMEPNEHLDLTIVSLIVDFVAIPLEVAVNNPLVSLGQTYQGISITRNNKPFLNL